MTVLPDIGDLHVRIIDAIANDIENTADLPDHTVVKYERPWAVFPENCPLACYWLQRKVLAPMGTNRWDSAVIIGISWQWAAVEEMQTLVENPEHTKENLMVMGRIERRIKVLASMQGDPGVPMPIQFDVPEAYQVLPAEMDFIPPSSIETGLVKGYAMGVQVNVGEL